MKLLILTCLNLFLNGGEQQNYNQFHDINRIKGKQNTDILPSQLYNNKISVNNVHSIFVNWTEFCTFVAKFKNSILNYK